ncbi:transglutaminase family protein [Mycolicibacterium sp. Y3]
MKRDVSARLDIDITAETTLEFQIAVATQSGADVNESLTFVLDGQTIEPEQVVGEHGNRIHTVDAPVGHLEVRYEAAVTGRSDLAPVTPYDRIFYLRPSRYAEADKFYGFAAKQFGQYGGSVTLLEKVSSWVGTHLDYVPGSSDPIDGAVDTLLAGRGVCRDYAHLVVALLRAMNVPARLVAVYAPGCEPMDFHAVAEALVDDQWQVVDATCLAPRSALVRIATGRDAADTAFLSNHKGAITLNGATVTAVVDGALPVDSVRDLVALS